MRGVKARGGDTIRLELNQAKFDNLGSFCERLINPQGSSDGPSFLRNH